MEHEAIRAVRIELGDGVEVVVHERADADAVLAAAVEGAAVDPYAAILWPTAVAVARELVGRVRPDERVLDVGAGTGLCALAAARLGAEAVALDHDVGALELIRAAAAVQGVGVRTSAFDLLGPEALPAADVVAFADLLYEAELARATARRAWEAMRGGARVVVGDPGRFTRAEFVREASRLGLAVEFRDVTVRLPGERLPSVVGVAWIPGDSR